MTETEVDGATIVLLDDDPPLTRSLEARLRMETSRSCTRSTPSQWIVGERSGTPGVRSAPGEGTVFTVSIPVFPPERG